MEEFIKVLRENGRIKALIFAGKCHEDELKKLGKTDEGCEKLRKEEINKCLHYDIATHSEIRDPFVKFATQFTLDAIVEKIYPEIMEGISNDKSDDLTGAIKTIVNIIFRKGE